MGKRINGVWGELRRRRVVSTAAAYAAVAFVLLQLGEILFPAFGLGPGAMRALLAGVFAVFPIVMALSWVYDVTRQGLRRTEPLEGLTNGEGAADPGPSFIMLGAVLISAAALGLGAWYTVTGLDAGPGAPPAGASIAVLPFADMSAAGDQAYLGDGIAEEILNVLAGVDGLRVAARTSSFAFRETTEDVRDIGQQLGVNTVLEGSIRRDSIRVRVTAQLIDTQSGFHLWSATYDEHMVDLFAVQDSIAGAIAEELLGRLEIPSARPEGGHVVAQAAVEAYWRGRAAWNARGATGIPDAIRSFQEALRIDSLYAAAHAGLADSYALLPQFVTSADPAFEWSRAEQSALRAIELDPDLAEAHASLGLVRALQGHRAAALASLGDAIDLNPSYASALHWRGNVLAEMGQLEAARDDASRAAALDALSAPIAADHGNILLWLGDGPGAQAEYERALELNFNFAPAHFGLALAALGRDEAVDFHMALAQWAAVTGVPVFMARELANAMLVYHETGSPAIVPPGLRSLADERRLNAGTLASLFALIGDREGTVTWLREAVADGSWVDQYPSVNSVYAPFRDGADFRQILVETTGS